MTPKQAASDFSELSVWKKLEILIVVGGLLSILVTTVTIIVWLLWPYKPIVVTNAKMTDHVVNQGQLTTYTTDYVKYMKSESIHRFFEDGLIFDAGSTDPIRPVGSGHGLQEIRIPESLPPGYYHLHIIVSFRVNPIKTIDYEFDTDTFQVLPSGAYDSDPTSPPITPLPSHQDTKRVPSNNGRVN